MRIDSSYGQFTALSLLSWATESPAQTSPASSSLFGPAALLTLGRGTPSAPAGSGALPSLDFSSALAALRTNSASAPVSPKQQREEAARLKRVAALVDQGRYDDARHAIQEIREDNPQSAPAIHARGVIELRQRQYAEAERYFRQAHALAPERGYEEDAEIARLLRRDDADLFAIARQMVATPQTRSQGTRLLFGLTQRNPLHTEARLLLAGTLLEQRDATGALSQYRLAIAIADPSQLERIETQLTRLTEIAPKAAYVRRLLGQTQLRLGKHEQAARTLAEATQLAEGDPVYRAEEAPAHVAIGREKLAAHDIEGALAAFERARELDFSSPDVRVALGEAYLARGELRTRQGSLSAAIADLNTAANKLRGTSNEGLRRRLAQTAFAAALTLEAQHLQGGQDVGDESLAFEIAFDLDPDNATYRSKWAEVSQRIGDELLADEKYRDAAQAYRRAYDLYPENQTYRDAAVSAYTSYGDEQMDKHDYDKAIEAYQAAHDIGRGDAVRVKLAAAYNARGLGYLAEGKLRRARNDFLRAMRLDPNNSEYQNNYNGIGG